MWIALSASTLHTTEDQSTPMTMKQTAQSLFRTLLKNKLKNIFVKTIMVVWLLLLKSLQNDLSSENVLQLWLRNHARSHRVTFHTGSKSLIRICTLCLEAREICFHRATLNIGFHDFFVSLPNENCNFCFVNRYEGNG